MSPEQWDALQEEIHAKCVDLEYAEASDNNLANFIISLLKINMKKDKINEELTELVGSDYDPNVTDWFFTRMNELENPQQPTSTQHKDERPSGNGEAAAKTSPTGSLDSHARPEGGNRMFAQAIGSVTNGGSPSSTRRSRSRSPDHHRHRPVRERSPIRDTHAATESSPRADSQRRVNFVQDGVPGSGRRSVFERLGRNAKVPPPARFDQQEHTQPMHQQQQQQQQQQQSAAAAAAPAVNMMPQAAMGMPMAMGQKPIPCKFFPYCMNPACPYLHPMQMPYMMMPPQPVKRIPVPCKNGEQCKRPDCHFLHPGDENPAEIMCKYDGSCTRPNCFYKHTVPPNPQNRGNKTLVLNKMERKFAEDEAEEKIVVKESADLLKKE